MPHAAILFWFTCIAAAEDEDFALEKSDIMREIEELERDEGTSASLASPGTQSRPIEAFTIPSRPLDLDSRPLEGSMHGARDS